jgi:serine/threonine-protein kinase
MLRGDPVCDPAADEATLLQFKLKLADRLVEYLPPYVVRNERLIHILQRMLSPDPGRRYTSVSEADSGPDGLHHVHKQLVHMGKDTEYGRELEHYLSKIVDRQPAL